MVAGWLVRRGCAEFSPDPGAAPGRVLRLTSKGGAARGNSTPP